MRLCKRCNKPAVNGRLCELHNGKGERTRGTTTERGYGGDWQRLRLWYLKQHPLCSDCEAAGKTRLAEEVHHIKTIRERPDLRLNCDNLMALCKPCHSRRTAGVSK